MDPESRQGWLAHLRSGLAKSRNNLTFHIKSAFSADKITEETWEQVETALIGADVGVESTAEIVDELRLASREQTVVEAEALTELLRSLLVRRLTAANILPNPGEKVVILVVGVNGTGKTTTIGKMAKFLAQRGASVALVAADTFRAAAIEQLEEWARHAGCAIIRQERGADPAAVVFDAVSAMRAGRHDVLLVDTAGRLHTYVNLMEELKKVKRVAVREAGDTPVRTLMVIDGTTGQNGIAQAKIFHDALGLDATVVTKIDGTARGGVVVAIERQLGVPIALVGVGEGVDDLRPFEPGPYVDALF